MSALTDTWVVFDPGTGVHAIWRRFSDGVIEVDTGVPFYALADMCHNGHPFEPGVDDAMEDEGRQPDPLWCNVCGEGRS